MEQNIRIELEGHESLAGRFLVAAWPEPATKPKIEDHGSRVVLAIERNHGAVEVAMRVLRASEVHGGGLSDGCRALRRRLEILPVSDREVPPAPRDQRE